MPKPGKGRAGRRASFAARALAAAAAQRPEDTFNLTPAASPTAAMPCTPRCAAAALPLVPLASSSGGSPPRRLGGALGGSLGRCGPLAKLAFLLPVRNGSPCARAGPLLPGDQVPMGCRASCAVLCTVPLARAPQCAGAALVVASALPGSTCASTAAARALGPVLGLLGSNTRPRKGTAASPLPKEPSARPGRARVPATRAMESDTAADGGAPLRAGAARGTGSGLRRLAGSGVLQGRVRLHGTTPMHP